MNILLVDEDAEFAQSVVPPLRNLGHGVVYTRSEHEAFRALHDADFHVVLTDIKTPRSDGLERLGKLKRNGGSAITVIVLTAESNENLAIRALRAGAFDYLRKPTDIDDLIRALERVQHCLRCSTEQKAGSESPDLERERSGLALSPEIQRIECGLQYQLGRDPLYIFSTAIQQVFEQARLFQPKRDVPVLIEGESGTGKELIARYLHQGETQAPGGPFIALNCAAMPGTLFQSELFGYEHGAYTGAKAGGSQGKVQLANDGTLFLDEIGELTPECQLQLLRVLETREYYAVGGLQKIHTNARFVFATNRKLAEEVAQGRFRRDLYHRINIGRITLPPLRDRRDEILPLALIFLDRFNRKHKKRFRGFAPKIEQQLKSNQWEGNIRELKNTIERAVILSDGDRLTILNHYETGPAPAPTTTTTHDDWELPSQGFNLLQHELHIVRLALDKHQGNRTQTAQYLGLSLKALQSRLHKLQSQFDRAPLRYATQ